MRYVNVQLDDESLATLRSEAAKSGLALSPWLRGFARILRMEITWKTPMGEILDRFHEYVTEEKKKDLERFLK
jgi:hypothetical protein